MKKNKTALVHGNFNIIHPGHLRILKFAKDCADKLIVAVNSDKYASGAAFVPEKLRIEALKSNNYVDKVILNKQPIEKIILNLKPDIVIKGKEHETKINPEEKVIKKYGGNLIFSSGEATFSSLDLVEKELRQSNVKKFSINREFMDRYKISIKNIKKTIKDFSKLRVLVIGDLIVDNYIFCEALGMSREDPSIVVKPQNSKMYLGGAGIVAAHAANLNAKTIFITVANNDKAGKFAEKELKKNQVETFFFNDKVRQTTIKNKYRSNNKTLFRVNDLIQSSIPIGVQKKILDKVKKLKNKIDLIVFSDFNYGVLPQYLVNKICSECKKSKIIIVADSQSSSQIGDITRFKNVDLITPTEYEARVSIKNQDDGLAVISSKISKSTGVKKILLKLAQDGVFIHEGSNKKVINDTLPALNNNPKDVAGAGDCFLITSSMALALKSNIWEMSVIGSLSAAIQISRTGNSPLNVKELINDLNQI